MLSIIGIESYERVTVFDDGDGCGATLRSVALRYRAHQRRNFDWLGG